MTHLIEASWDISHMINVNNSVAQSNFNSNAYCVNHRVWYILDNSQKNRESIVS